MRLKQLYIFVILSLLSLGIKAQCAMCKAVVESSTEGGENVAGGINDGIIYLMFIPYILMGAVGYFIYRHHKRNKQNA